jgi:hypothetical protein
MSSSSLLIVMVLVPTPDAADLPSFDTCVLLVPGNDGIFSSWCAGSSEAPTPDAGVSGFDDACIVVCGNVVFC